MSVIMLPTSPAVRAARPIVLSFGTVLKPYLGGPTQRINRIGTRWALRVTMPPMYADAARPWVNALAQGSESAVCIAIPQDIDVGNPGNPRVSAAVTAGMALALKGMTPGYPVRQGQFLSIIHAGQRYVHIFSADGSVEADGTIDAAIWPMIRVSLSVNDVVEVAEPKIQGFLDAPLEYDILTMPMVQIPDFTISEAA